MPSLALQRLLDASLAYPPEYANELSSHLPMALAALAGLGADEARLHAFFVGYVRRFNTPPPAVQSAVPDWRAVRGRFERFASLWATFAAALTRDGRDVVLREALPDLLSGVGGAAFHGAIRTAHAVESGHDGELAAALAYWAARWMNLAAPAPRGPDIDTVADWLDAMDTRLKQDAAPWQSAAPLIAGRMRDASHTAAYQEGAGRLRSAGRDRAALLHELALCAAARYAATRNFTVLHMATAARAARVLAPWLPRDDAALAPLWHAVAAASLASGVATAAPRQALADAGLDWAQLRARARGSDDDHVIKLVHAMASQDALAPHPVWLSAAARAVAG